MHRSRVVVVVCLMEYGNNRTQPCMCLEAVLSGPGSVHSFPSNHLLSVPISNVKCFNVKARPFALILSCYKKWSYLQKILIKKRNVKFSLSFCLLWADIQFYHFIFTARNVKRAPTMMNITNINVAPIAPLRMCVIKIVTFKRSHPMW